MVTAVARAALRANPLIAAGGWRLASLLTPGARSALAEEALRSHAAAAQVARLDRSPDEDQRRGNPARYLESAPGGARLGAFYGEPRIRALLRRLTNLDWVRSGEQATFSYYCRPGHHLGMHRDIDACDLAVITCLYESGAPQSGLAGALCLWPSRSHEPLADIRADPNRGCVPVRLRPGQSIVLLGGLIPHRLEPIEVGHVRIVAPLCFHAAGSGGG